MAAIRSLPVALVLLGLLGATACLAKEFVLTLTHENFDEEVKKNDFIVVEFYAPWCGHCKSLAPEYEKAAKQLEEENVSVKLAKVDADNAANKPLAQKYKVQGFPTLKIFRNGDLENPQDYKGPREAAGIVSFVKKQAGPATLELLGAAELKEIMAAELVFVVGVFKDLESAEFKAFSQVAETLRSEFLFRHTTDASILPVEQGKLPSLPAVRVIKQFDDGFGDTTEFGTDALQSFIMQESLPIVVEFSQDPKDRPFLNRVFESPSKKVLFFLSYNASGAGELKEKFKALATARPEGLVFVQGEEKENDHALKYFGLASSDCPVVVIHDGATNFKFYRTNVDAAGMEDFLTKYQAGEEEQKLKSEAVPEKNDGPVTVAVGKNFNELVLNSKKNVLIEFYAPWCGHCKSLEPIYKEVGAAFKDDPSVVIAKLDYTANDLPTDKFKVEGFPTIYFHTASGEVLKYEGERTKDAMVEFVKASKTGAGNASEPEEAEAAAEAAEKAAEAAKAGKDEL